MTSVRVLPTTALAFAWATIWAELASARLNEAVNGSIVAELASAGPNESVNGSIWSELASAWPNNLANESSSFFATNTGYQFTGTSTSYGPVTRTACGGIDPAKLVEGTGYYAVASAQAMQTDYSASYGGCTWECKDGRGRLVASCRYDQCGGVAAADGCTCRQNGACWCGQTPKNQASSGTASMGCFSCARARFLRQRPYDRQHLSLAQRSEFASHEIKVVVADSCPHAPQPQWCPARPGDLNACGEKNHFDFTAYPAGINNHFVAFTPEPCSPHLQERINALNKGCSHH